MGISDWVWATYINSSLTLADWSPGHTSSLLTHSVSPESDTITLTEINWWVWRSYSRSVTSPKPLQRSQPLHAVTGQLCGGERGGRVWSFHFALFLFLCSFFSYSWPDWTVSVTFHASAKLWMPSRRSWTCEPLSTYLNDIASPLYDLPAFHPAFPFSAFFLLGGEWFCSQCAGTPFSIDLGIKFESGNKQSESQSCSKHTNLRSLWSRSWSFVQTSKANSRCKFPFGDFVEIISPNILRCVAFWPSTLIISTNPWRSRPSGAGKSHFRTICLYNRDQNTQ